MSRIELKNINKFYGKNHILKNVDLTIEDGDFMTLLGPSGCGKTTTLRAISGLEHLQSGTIFMDDRQIVNAEEAYFEQPSKRGLNLVFQSYALWPHMTVTENVAFGLKVKKLPKNVIDTKVKSSLERMQILEYRGRYPSELSGGQQQRVAIARAIVSEPSLLLLDEPLSNLDAKLRVDMRSELKRLHIETGTTIIYVTHDQVEALTMSTKIAIFREGKIVQVAEPLTIYNNPINLYVSHFIGNPSINFIESRATRTKDGMTVNGLLGKLDFNNNHLTDKTPDGEFDVVLGVRPEQINVLRNHTSANNIEALVYTCMPAGSETLISVRVGDVALMIKELGIVNYQSNETVFLDIDSNKLNVFDKESTNLIKYSV